MEKRNTNFDFYKSMLIIGVVLGHCVTALKAGSDDTVFLHIFVRTYDMPMFAFISGIFLQKSIKNHRFTVNLLNKICTIFFNLVIWNWIFNLISGNFSLKVNNFWFLWALFIGQVIILTVVHVFGKFKPLCIAVLLGACVFLHFGKIRLFENYHVGFLFFPMLIGMAYEPIKQKLDKLFCQKQLAYTVSINVLFLLLLCFWNSEYSIWTTGCNIFAFHTPLKTAGKIIYRGLIGIIGSFAMMENFNKLHILLTKLSHELIPSHCDTVHDFICKIGSATMEIYILQALFVERFGGSLIKIIVAKLSFNPFIISTGFLGYFEAPIVAIFSVIFCYFLQYYIKKIPFIGKFIFGYPIGKLIETKIKSKKNTKTV